MGHNPTGIVLTLERRKAIYAVCSKYDVVIIEDEPYWYLQYPSAELQEAKSRDQPVPEPAVPEPLPQSSGYPYLDSLVPSFLNIDTDGRVIRLDTFSKTIAPGCRLGFITAQPAIIEKVAR
jgi:DNA-binding transcriptional MocR family regulator